MVAIAKRIHLFPYRTQKLSSLVSKILGWRRPGKIESCHLKDKREKISSLFYHIIESLCKFAESFPEDFPKENTSSSCRRQLHIPL